MIKRTNQLSAKTGLISLLFALALFCQNSPLFAQSKPANSSSPVALGTSKVWGKVDGVNVQSVVQSPSGEQTPLQVICVFEYTEGDIFLSPPALPAELNGMVHVDKALNGIITDLRKSGRFAGHAFETLLLTPPAGAIGAKRLLIIGLGDRNKFAADVMVEIGAVAMREALRLGVNSYAFAADLKDAGIDSPTGLVSENVVKGAFDAYRTQQYLKSKNMADNKPITSVSLLAGPAYFTISGDGIKSAIEQLNNR